MYDSLKKIIKKSGLLINSYDYIREIYYKNILSDEKFVSKKFKKKIGRNVDIENPVDFRDKLQWLKLNWYNPKAVQCADKYEVRMIVSELIGNKYLNDVLNVYESVNEIEIDRLPKSFVFKATHSSGHNFVCYDKDLVNWKQKFKDMQRWLNNNYFWTTREWVYKDIKPRIICERFLSENGKSQGLTDYKFYCFNGVPKYCQIIRDREVGGTIDFYDIYWNHMSFNGLQNLPRSENKITKPEKYEEMLHIAKILSEPFPFVRVDLYYVNNQIYFGELTFFPRSGYGSFNPPIWNEKIGNLLDLSEVMSNQ